MNPKFPHQVEWLGGQEDKTGVGRTDGRCSVGVWLCRGQGRRGVVWDMGGAW